MKIVPSLIKQQPSNNVFAKSNIWLFLENLADALIVQKFANLSILELFNYFKKAYLVPFQIHIMKVFQKITK